jgi:bacterioferritin
MANQFKIDLENIKERARSKMEDGALTGAYKADKDEVIKVLNEAIATEIVCILRYKNNYYMADGLNAGLVAQEFLEHANEEQQHLDWLSERITQLGGVPNYNPEGLTQRAHADYHEGKGVPEMIRENLVAERIAIEIYSEMIQWLGNSDPTTRRLIEDILKQEEEHADDLVGLLKKVDL